MVEGAATNPDLLYDLTRTSIVGTTRRFACPSTLKEISKEFLRAKVLPNPVGSFGCHRPRTPGQGRTFIPLGGCSLSQRPDYPCPRAVQCTMFQ